MPDSGLPDLAVIIGPLLQRVPAVQQPLLIAIAERMAADRYRGWADDPRVASHRARLLACVEREEEIARRVEGLYPRAGEMQREILAANPDLEQITRDLFAGWSLHQQLAIQANGERLGAATWRALAQAEPDPARAAVIGSCAPLEEESALVLEAIVKDAP